MKSKRSVRLLAILGVLVLVLAACGSSETETTEAPDTTEAPETTEAPDMTEAPEATEAPMEPGALGEVRVEAGEDIQIRSLQVITGPNSTLGIPEERGIRLAVEHYGDINGFSVNVGTGLDDLCSADGGQAAAQTIVSDTQVVGVIGTSCSGAATAAMPLISDAGMVMISGSNTSPALTSDLLGTAGTDYHEGYYRTAHNDFIQGAAAATFVYEGLGLTQVGLIHDGDPYTNGLTNAFQDAFEELGGTIVVHTAVAPDVTDAVPVLTEVAGAEPELVFHPIFIPAATAITQQRGDVAGLEDVIFMGADGILSTTDFLPLPETAGMYFSGPDLRFGDNRNQATDKSADEFLADYEAAYGESPTAPFWAHAYDATTLLLSAIEEVAVMDGDTLVIDRQALRDALSAVSGFEGITGTLNCDEFGDCAASRITVLRHDDPNDVEATLENVVFEYAP